MFVFLQEKREVGDLLIVDGKPRRIAGGPSGPEPPWMYPIAEASEEEKAVWDVMES